MSFLKLTQEMENCIQYLCHVALSSKGLEVLNHVNAVFAAVQDAKKDAQPSVVSEVDKIANAAEVVAQAVMPTAAPVIEAAQTIVDSVEGK